MSHFGAPAGTIGTQCAPVTNAKLVRKLVTRNVGPFRVTGHVKAVESLELIFRQVKAQDPVLYASLGTAGMLCARLVRGSQVAWSNHSFGCAIDITINGQLDRRGDDRVQQGLLDLYPFFYRNGWYWGAEYRTEDGMHFEVSNELFTKWLEEGEA